MQDMYPIAISKKFIYLFKVSKKIDISKMHPGTGDFLFQNICYTGCGDKLRIALVRKPTYEIGFLKKKN